MKGFRVIPMRSIVPAGNHQANTRKHTCPFTLPPQDGSSSSHLEVHWDLATRGMELLTATSPLSAQQLLPQKPFTSPGGDRLLPVLPPDMSVLDEGLPPPPAGVDQAAALARAVACQLAPARPGVSQKGISILIMYCK